MTNTRPLQLSLEPSEASLLLPEPAEFGSSMYKASFLPRWQKKHNFSSLVGVHFFNRFFLGGLRIGCTLFAGQEGRSCFGVIHLHLWRFFSVALNASPKKLNIKLHILGWFLYIVEITWGCTHIYIQTIFGVVDM